MISLSGIGKEFLAKTNGFLTKVVDWIFDKFIEPYLKTIIQVCFVLFLVMVIWIVCDYFMCMLCSPSDNCRNRNLFDVAMSIMSVLGGGLISVGGVIYEERERRRKETTAINAPDDILREKLFRQNEKVLNFLTVLSENNSSKTAPPPEPREFSGIFDIFIDASIEDQKLVNQVTSCLENNSISYLSPIGFKDSEINVIKVMEARLKSCRHVIIICGNMNLVVWAKNRLKFYDKLRNNMGKQLSIFPKICVFHTDDVKFDQQGDQNVEFVKYPKDQEVIQCDQLVSPIREKTGKSS